MVVIDGKLDQKIYSFSAKIHHLFTITLCFSEYNDLHRSVLQTLMGHGTIEKSDFNKIFNQLWQKCKILFLVCEVL